MFEVHQEWDIVGCQGRGDSFHDKEYGFTIHRSKRLQR